MNKLCDYYHIAAKNAKQLSAADDIEKLKVVLALTSSSANKARPEMAAATQMRHEAIFRSMVQKTQILSVVQAAFKGVQYDRHMLLCRVCWCVFLASHAPQDEFTKFHEVQAKQTVRNVRDAVRVEGG